MDQGVIVSCKQHYQHKYLDEVLVVIEEEEDMEEDTRGQQTVNNIKSYKIWHLQFHVLERCQSDNSLYAWKKIMMGEDPELNFEDFEQRIFTKFYHMLEKKMLILMISEIGLKRMMPIPVTKFFPWRK